MLTLVPTPVGNLADITQRAIDLLQSVDVILCEDTRTSGILLHHYGIKKPLQAYHQHNEHKTVEGLITRLKAGEKMALITDAGTPGISDPAFLLVRACVKNDIEVQCLPGATAFVPALVVSGLPTNRFVFEGFIPLKKGRKTFLESLAREPRTLIFYESPMRMERTLRDFAEYFGAGRPCSVSREISKKFEETRRGTLEELHHYFSQHKVKGEMVIVVAGFDGD